MVTKKGTPYYLRDNPFGEENSFIAQAVTRSVADLNKVIARMVDKGSSLTEVDLRGVIILFRKVIIDLISEGVGVSIDSFLNIRPTISGVFEGYDDTFDRSRHQLNLKVQLNVKFMEDLLKEITMEKIDRPERAPLLKLLHDMATESYNKSLTVGNIVRLEGKYLSFDRQKGDEGIYIYSKEGDQFIKIDFRDKSSNRELRFLIPPQVATLGEEVYIEVKTRYGTKLLREGRTKFLLRVISL